VAEVPWALLKFATNSKLLAGQCFETPPKVLSHCQFRLMMIEAISIFRIIC
jgi:hypothetical protein